MQPLTRKRLTYATFGTYYILGGIEYAVIIPTLFLYIETEFQAETYYMGLILAAYSLTGLFSGPIMGRLADKTRKIKLLLLICNCFMIGGSLMYWIGLSKNFLVASRLVAGCGSGLDAIIIGEVARSTSEAERTGVISILIGVRQAGLLLGPGFNLFLREADFKIGSLSVNKHNVPGAFMAVLWFLMQIITFVFYYDLSKVQDEIRSLESSKTEINGDVKMQAICTNGTEKTEDGLSDTTRNLAKPNADIDSEKNSYHYKITTDHLKSNDNDIPYIDFTDNISCHSKTNSCKESFDISHKAADDERQQASDSLLSPSDLIVAAENVMANAEDCHTVQTIEKRPGDDKILREERKMTRRVLLNDFIRDEVIAVAFVNFSCIFNQLAMEAMVTPLTSRYLHWGEMENSIMLCVAGVLLILVFILVRWLSRRLRDRTLLLIGWLFIMLATCWLMYVVPTAGEYSSTANIYRFMVGFFLDMVGLPFAVGCAASIFSKLMRKEIQGFSQGIMRSFTGLSIILAPIWASSTLQWPYLMLGVMIALKAISMVMLLISWSKLKPKSEIEKEQAKKEQDKPLLDAS